MNDKSLYKTVATAVRVEYEKSSDDLFLVFKITDKNLKKKIKEDWTQDIDLKLIGKDLIELTDD